MKTVEILYESTVTLTPTLEPTVVTHIAQSRTIIIMIIIINTMRHIVWDGNYEDYLKRW
jgi:hypothetical protein